MQAFVFDSALCVLHRVGGCTSLEQGRDMALEAFRDNREFLIDRKCGVVIESDGRWFLASGQGGRRIQEVQPSREHRTVPLRRAIDG